MRRVLTQLWHSEIPEISECYRWLGSSYVLLFIGAYSLGFLQLLHLSAYLGPGLGDWLSFAPLTTMLQRLYQSEHRALFAVMTGLLLFVTLFRLGAMAAGYYCYRDKQQRRFSLQLLLVFSLFNLLATLSIPLVLAGLGLILAATGASFELGWHWVSHNASLANHWVATRVPTLVALPAPIAVICFSIVAGFFHYWLHRLGHERRLLWLLLHRPHHMPPALIQPATTAVFTALPLFLLVVLPYNLILGACAKLFAERPLYAEMIVYNCVILIPEIFGHQTALYDWGARNRLIRWASYLSGGGVYHYMHHSAKAEHCNRRGTNLVNIGGGPAFIWDQVFGTFCPLAKSAPPVGLTGQPRLAMNPLRLLLAGLLQLGTELRHNHSLRLRWKILSGASDYTPPLSRNYAIADQTSAGRILRFPSRSGVRKPRLAQPPAKTKAQ